MKECDSEQMLLFDSYLTVVIYLTLSKKRIKNFDFSGSSLLRTSTRRKKKKISLDLSADFHINAYTVQSLSNVQLFCDVIDCSSSGSSVHGIFQARVLESVAISLSRRSFQPWTQTHVFCIASRFLTTEPPGKPMTGYKIT